MRGVSKRGKEAWKRLGIFLLLFFMLLVLLNSVRKVYNKKESAEEALVKMHEEVANLALREQELKRAETRLQTTEGLEFELRKKFSVAREGESVAIIVASEATSSVEEVPKTLWQKIKSWFE